MFSLISDGPQGVGGNASRVGYWGGGRPPGGGGGGGVGKGLWFPVLAEALRFQAVDGAQRPWRPPGGEARVVLGRRWCDAPGFELALLELMIKSTKVKHVTLVKPWSTCVITPENLANNH
jgi:hypothetical protein